MAADDDNDDQMVEESPSSRPEKKKRHAVIDIDAERMTRSKTKAIDRSNNSAPGLFISMWKLLFLVDQINPKYKM